MSRYKCPECGRTYETHAYCNHHRTSVKCIENPPKRKKGLFQELTGLESTNPGSTNPGSSLGPNTFVRRKYS